MVSGKFATDREERINYERMRNYRLARAKEQMEKHGLGCLVTWDAFDIRYLSGTLVNVPTRWLEMQAVVLPRNGDPYVHAGSTFDVDVQSEHTPWHKGRIFPALGAGKWSFTVESVERVVKTVADIMAEHGVTNEPLGLDGSTSELLYQEAFKQAGIKCVDGKETMFEARKIKSQDEIECVRMACANAEAAFSDIANALKPGVTECELVGIGMNTLYRLGADEAQEFVCSSGPRTNPLHIDYTDRQIRPGDLVIVDINGNSWQGYKSCYYRTFCCGKPTAEQEEIFELCRAYLYDPMSAVKAGATNIEIAETLPTGTGTYRGHDPKYWGYDKWEETAGIFGHGIGISLHELPQIMKFGPAVTLEEGMVIAMETWAGRKGGKHGVRLEEDLVVTKDGYELLTQWPIDKLTECAI